MAWKDKLQPASFRGVPFEVESDDATFGRRVQVHEYPHRDQPYVEDLGRAAREMNITAFLVGPDYMDKRDRLLAAIEEAGPGTLIHPWYGERKVCIREPASVSHSTRNGGMCVISLAFVEAGELAFPEARDSHGAQSLIAADALQAAAIDDFAESFSVDQMPAFVTSDALSVFGGGLGNIESALGSARGLLANPLGSLQSRLPGLIGDSAGLAGSVFGMFRRGDSVLTAARGLFGGAGVYSMNRDAVRALLGLSQRFQAPARPASLSPSRQRSIENERAANALMSRAMLVQAAGMTATMPLPVYDDAVEIRKQFNGALDVESLTASDEVYTALQDLRAKVHADITNRLASSARLQTIRPKGVTPALVLAYDHYGDVRREQELVEANRLSRPGFVPAEPLKVLAV
ncbi:MAG TPA: DNA circularization N-terminal domain-containing protein [Noviherbaspirillum sp.]|nr:DNA circularization N-terminal domain-containing protein [Noviherbaspirillum sp.]